MLKQKQTYTAIGLMSGTSFDGVDAALIETDGLSHINIKDGVYLPYPKELQDRIASVISNDYTQIWEVERDLTVLHADACSLLLKKLNISNKDIDLLGFHGQTIKHDPKNKITVQLGNAPLLSQLTGCTVVSDFRSAHVASGGQGAPLVPIFLQAMQPQHTKSSCYMNIGGVSNLCYIDGSTCIGFDVGIGNAPLNDIARAKAGIAYDDKGALAAQGVVNITLLNKLISDSYFIHPHPKSLDRNHFNLSELYTLDLHDALATLCEFIAHGIDKGLDLLPTRPSAIIISGGGRKNEFLLSRIAHVCNLMVLDIDTMGLDGDLLEAHAFGYIGVRCALGLPCFIGSEIKSGVITLR